MHWGQKGGYEGVRRPEMTIGPRCGRTSSFVSDLMYGAAPGPDREKAQGIWRAHRPLYPAAAAGAAPKAANQCPEWHRGGAAAASKPGHDMKRAAGLVMLEHWSRARERREAFIGCALMSLSVVADKREQV